MMKKYFSSKSFLLGFLLVGLLFLIMVIGFFYMPFDPNENDVMNKLQSPSSEHLLGTDHLGRDILSRVMKGSRVSFFIGAVVVFFGSIVGCSLGAIAGYFGGVWDDIISKIIDIQLAFPGILIALMFVAVFGNSLANLSIALSIMAIPRFARMARSGFMRYREADFVKAARVRGASDFRIITLHILPNVSSELLVSATLSFSGAIMSEAGLSYLGLGIQPPDPSFGKMLSEAQASILTAPWYVFIPATIIIILVLGFNLMSDGISETNKY